jgi:Flp pilus assembly pilin Flp
MKSAVASDDDHVVRYPTTQRRLFRCTDEAGASLVEYALLVALIAVAALLGIVFFGDQLGGSYSSIGSHLNGT